MTPEEIRRHIDEGTFMEALMKAVGVRVHENAAAGPHQRGTLKLELEFPEWYFAHISLESRTQIEELVRENVLEAYHPTR